MKSFYLILIVGIILFSQTSSADVEPFETKSTKLYSYQSRDKRLKMSVEVEIIDKKLVRETINEDGDRISTHHDGRVLPKDFWFYSHPSIIKSIKIWVGDTQIPFDKKHWDDISGIRLFSITPTKPLKTEFDIKNYYHEIRQIYSNPQLYQCQDSKNLLLEWLRREDGDTATIFRWIITPTGQALRHSLGPDPMGDY